MILNLGTPTWVKNFDQGNNQPSPFPLKSAIEKQYQETAFSIEKTEFSNQLKQDRLF